jgi:hypothetical protein
VKEISKANIERSMILFIVGTIIIVIAIIVITADVGFRAYDIYFTGYAAMLGLLAYLVGLVLVVSSIHSLRNFWGWLDFPLFFAVNYIVSLFAPDFDEMPIPYRLLSISIFPLNYLALLILFLVSIYKAKVI